MWFIVLKQQSGNSKIRSTHDLRIANGLQNQKFHEQKMCFIYSHMSKTSTFWERELFSIPKIFTLSTLCQDQLFHILTQIFSKY